MPRQWSRDRHGRMRNRQTSQSNPTPGRYTASEQPDPWWDNDHCADDQDGDDLDQIVEY